MIDTPNSPLAAVHEGTQPYVTLIRGKAGPSDLRTALDQIGVRPGQSFQVSALEGKLPNGTLVTFADSGLILDFRSEP